MGSSEGTETSVPVEAGQRPLRLDVGPDGASAVFRNRPESVPGVRALVRQVMCALPPEVVDVAELVASELASNAARHTRGEKFVLLLIHDPVVRVTRVVVEDRGPRRTLPKFPRRDQAVPTDEEALLACGGRGLGMVARLCPEGCSARPVPFSDRWIVEGKVGWDGGFDGE